jgi:hypothetical protein
MNSNSCSDKQATRNATFAREQENGLQSPTPASDVKQM